MTISSSTSHKIVVFAALFALVQPAGALAAVRIADVMYDPPGADTGREWVKIQNTGDSGVNLAGYRLFEGGVNHKLTAAVGTSTLEAHATAVIVTDPAQYETDHPNFAGTIFKSSFSLSNTGETIALKDAKLQTVDSYSYTAPPKVAASKPAAKSTTKVPATRTKSAKSVAGSDQAASVVLAPVNLPHVSSIVIYSVLLAALLLWGISMLLYTKLFAPKLSVAETFDGAGEFEIE